MHASHVENQSILMKTSLECIPCFTRQAAEAIAQTVDDPPRRETLLRKILREISEADWQGSPPVIAQNMHRIIRRELDCRDPYYEIKQRMNATAQRILPALREAMENCPDRLEAAVRLAIGGNLLDAGAKTQIDIDDLPQHMNAIWNRPLQGDVRALFKAAAEARHILYLADNAGEIFFDRVLIEALPPGKVTVFVRGAPIINDATLEDAMAAGLPEIAPVFDNGSDAPGTLLEDCSESFRTAFDQADMIIAKGQGNYETLSDTTRPVFFLFVVKCPVIAAQVGASVGTLIVKR